MNLKSVTVILLTLISPGVFSQENPSDTIIVPLGQSSRIIFTVGDPDDLDILQHYNFQALFDDMIRQLRDAYNLTSDSSDMTNREENEEDWRITADEGEDDDDQDQDEDEEDDDDQDEDRDDAEADWDGDGHRHDLKWRKSRRGKIGQTWQSYNIDLGTNNYLSGDQFPDGGQAYAVRPWGSWYVGINSVQRTRLARNFFAEWGLGVSWYSFKFQEDNMMVIKDELGVRFASDSRDVDFVKSKLSATFINVSLVPVLDFGEHSRKHRIWHGDADGFRFGVGPYVGYRVSSKSKLVYESGDDREKEKNRSDFYLNNLRYGFRLQLGIRSTDLFINYDMNDLFSNDKGPALNAISFGLIL